MTAMFIYHLHVIRAKLFKKCLSKTIVALLDSETIVLQPKSETRCVEAA